ncbi:MAG TPA: hypothetical protein VHC19_28560 [Pirellulales bacterium]|jgi:hypothetical protein|nr:hypothetical protein [Pirellulales bacterium]
MAKHPITKAKDLPAKAVDKLSHCGLISPQASSDQLTHVFGQLHILAAGNPAY